MQTDQRAVSKTSDVKAWGSSVAMDFEPVVAAIKAHNELRTIPGVFGVRPGFRMVHGELTANPAIIVVTSPTDSVGQIPTQVGGIPVEARPATPREWLEGLIPLSAWERPVDEAQALAAAAAPHIGYKPPDPPLPQEPMTVKNITCHVGPDFGWATLKPFLEQTTSSLTVAMYEFYADYIVDTMVNLGNKPGVSLDLILQVTSNDEEVEAALRETWDDRLEFQRASVSGQHRVFNNSYHTKVAVRDSSSMWLSSGNWSPTSQPVILPGSDQVLYQKGNREWHIVIDDPEISQLFERFIRHDIAQAAAAGAPDAPPILPDLLVPMAVLQAAGAVIQPHPFENKRFADSGATIQVKTLMSPDNYADEVLQLIQEAEDSLYLQFSYIRQPSQQKFDDIIDAISEKMQDDDFDLRVIVGSSQESAHSELLIGQRHWKPSRFHRQTSKIHNKGILVDGKIAVVGSNNWSSDGTQYNRDASLVFHSPEITRYFTEVFLFDWDKLSKPIGSAPDVSPVIAPEAGPTPLGMARIPWQAWFDE